MLTLWNTYAFLVLYANANAERLAREPGGPPGTGDDLDAWELSRLQAST